MGMPMIGLHVRCRAASRRRPSRRGRRQSRPCPRAPRRRRFRSGRWRRRWRRAAAGCAKIASPDCCHDLRDDLGQPREVRAADAEQDAGDGQHRDRQHHALADFLEEREGVLEGGHGWDSCFGFRGRARGLPRPSRHVERRARRGRGTRRRQRRRICALTVGIAGRLTLSSSTPRPRGSARHADRWRCRRRRRRTGCAACAPRTVCAMRRSTAGIQGHPPCGASFGWPRSIASVYCVRSLVPMEKKSASSAKTARHHGRRRALPP